MISIKDYAKDTGVSYEAVRQRIKRYQTELEGHIHRQGRTQFLDDVAVAFLNDHRLIQNPTIVYDRGAGEDFRRLREERDEAKNLAKEYWEQLKEKEKTMRILAEENKALRLQASSVARLEADNEAQRAKTLAAEKALQEAQEGAEAARTAAEDEKKILEGFIQDAKKELATVQEEAKTELAEKDKRIQELENRSRWQRFLDVFK